MRAKRPRSPREGLTIEVWERPDCRGAFVKRCRGDAPVSSHTHTNGSGFQARHFSEDMFDGRMDPLLMVDHFVMTEPTFEPHLHAGISTH